MKSRLLIFFLALPAPVAVAQLLAAAAAGPARATQQRTVTGVVRDQASCRPLLGVAVLIKGTSRGTDAQGRYSLPVPGAVANVLRFSYVGYLPVERPVGNAPTLDVLLRADTRQLSEVVVTASGAGPCGGRRGGGSLYPIQLKI